MMHRNMLDSPMKLLECCYKYVYNQTKPYNSYKLAFKILVLKGKASLQCLYQNLQSQVRAIFTLTQIFELSCHP